MIKLTERDWALVCSAIDFAIDKNVKNKVELTALKARIERSKGEKSKKRNDDKRKKSATFRVRVLDGFVWRDYYTGIDDLESANEYGRMAAQEFGYRRVRVERQKKR